MTGRTVALVGGTGHLGIGLAMRLAHAGIEVVIGSRNATKAQEAAVRVDRDKVRGATNPEAGRLAELIIITVPYAAHRTTLQTLGELADGKVVVDTTLPLGESHHPIRLERPPGESAAEEAQQILPRARVVAAFHTVSAGMLADLSRPPQGDVLLCGNEAEAKATLGELVRAMKMRPVDVGELAAARVLEQLARLVLVLNRRYRRHDLGITVAGLDT